MANGGDFSMKLIEISHNWLKFTLLAKLDYRREVIIMKIFPWPCIYHYVIIRHNKS